MVTRCLRAPHASSRASGVYELGDWKGGRGRPRYTRDQTAGEDARGTRGDQKAGEDARGTRGATSIAARSATVVNRASAMSGGIHGLRWRIVTT